MMRSIKSYPLTTLLITLAGLFPSAISAQGAADKFYGKQVFLAADASKNAQESAKILAQWLDKITGAEFTIVDTPGKQGIFLVLADGKTLPAVDLKALKAQESSEAFLIYSTDANRLWIVAKSDLALEHGIYWYLEKLGCRWLNPSEKWTVIPRRSDITLKVNSLQAPAFATRDFFGSGGWGRPAIDFYQRIGESWALYKRENLLGGIFHLGGHAGEGFNIAHKQELLDHPEYLAEIDGKRQPWGMIIKPCYANPGLQAMYVKDRLATLKQNLAKNPATMTTSVEPADGGGHCECAECKKLGSVSDRVFTLANLVAKAVAKEFPGKYVNLYAYNEHAMVPAIPIEPNVIVSLAPYAFQRTGLSADELIKTWGDKHSFMGIYDYWNIPDWSRNLPDVAPKMVVEKIRFWQKNHVKVFFAESTFCNGSMGLNWYLASRLCWDPAQNENAIVDDFFNKAFGSSQAPIREMYLTWGSEFMLTDHELGVCFRNLQKALTLTTDPAIRARIIDMGRYVHFLRLYFEYGAAKGPARVECAKAIIQYNWSIYYSNMVQVFRMAQLINRDVKPNLEDINPEKPIWKDFKQLTDEEILLLMADGAAKYQPLDFEMKRYSQKLAPLSDTANPAAAKLVETGSFAGSTTFTFAVRPQETGHLVLKLSIGKYPGRADKITVTDPDGKVVLQTTVPAEGTWTDLDIPTGKPGAYVLSIFDQKNLYALQVPGNVPFVCSGAYTSTDLSPRTYFFVPAGMKKVAIYSPGVVPLKLFDPDGKPVKVERNEQGKALVVIDVPAGMDGKCWSFAGFKSWSPMRLLNVPNVFALSPDGMMVPEEVKPKPLGNAGGADGRIKEKTR